MGVEDLDVKRPSEGQAPPLNTPRHRVVIAAGSAGPRGRARRTDPGAGRDRPATRSPGRELLGDPAFGGGPLRGQDLVDDRRRREGGPPGRDTLVREDPHPVLEGKFDFTARPGSGTPDAATWEGVFERHGRPLPEWVPSRGFLAFKNGVHREVEEWLRFLGAEFPDFDALNLRDQYALALSVSESDCEGTTARR